MSVVSYSFLLAFFPLALILFRVLKGPSRQVWLLLTGLLFCAWGAPQRLVLLGCTGYVTYRLGLGMDRQDGKNRLRLALGCVAALAPLVVFKYLPLGHSLGSWAPLGLSFVTFQQLFWLRDRYYGEAEGVSALDYACCLTFFPTVSSGPITRVGELVPQLRRPRAFSWDDMASGLWCFSLGLFKKVLLSGIFAGAADWGFPRAGQLSATDAALTALCYALQLYFDFSGYCDMVWGGARMMGIDLPVNFDSPYRATSVSSFWKRWHATLNRFFTQCVYIPLGGSRRGMAVTCRNIFIVFLLSGIWHGAGWGFLIWGALHGAAMVIERLCRGHFTLPKPLGWLFTFLFVAAAWVFFRADSPAQAMELFHDLFRGGWVLPSSGLAGALVTPETRAMTLFAGMIRWNTGNLFSYKLPLLSIPVGCALLLFPNPVRQAQSFRPSVWKGLVCVLILVWSVFSLSGVETFIYANF